MNIFLVSIIYESEFEQLLGIFSTLELAEAELNKYIKITDKNDYNKIEQVHQKMWKRFREYHDEYLCIQKRTIDESCI
jgi:hypothetical protein